MDKYSSIYYHIVVFVDVFVDDETRAVRFVLEINFVSSLTSLFVTTAQNSTTLASLGDEIVQDFPYKMMKQHYVIYLDLKLAKRFQRRIVLNQFHLYLNLMMKLHQRWQLEVATTDNT